MTRRTAARPAHSHRTRRESGGQPCQPSGSIPVIGGARVITDEDPVLIDIEVDRQHRRQGHATRLFAEIEAAGYDVESGSNQSLATGMLSPLGYAFQAGRRAKTSRATKTNLEG